MVTLTHSEWKEFRRDSARLRRVNRITCLLANAGIVKVQRKKRKKRPYLFERQNHRCAYCFKQTKLTIDHVISLRMGGLDEVDNMVGACEKCNSIKKTIDGYTFYLMLHPGEGLADALKELLATQPWVKTYLHEVAKYSSILLL